MDTLRSTTNVFCWSYSAAYLQFWENLELFWFVWKLEHPSFSQMRIYIFNVGCCYWGSVLSSTKYLFNLRFKSYRIQLLVFRNFHFDTSFSYIQGTSLHSRVMEGLVLFLSLFSLYMLYRAGGGRVGGEKKNPQKTCVYKVLGVATLVS